ncbi:M6 family metalloprotease domain-containing protein [Cytobacillus sp. IB215316]|uniref:M6 family metalloprotease domain-containing protein n=1 Tax=Cytobacillus sp. IB215316 TaxID=3097354 RepID=UPI002A0F3C59|nr:M6 family metalloprotease domain-containing protein [Cytobacillus sp. IB215316]MDX8362126.1 M6 family metalloprotease domain-containing protein [Cytobacillus sp. IB215316]
MFKKISSLVLSATLVGGTLAGTQLLESPKADVNNESLKINLAEYVSVAPELADRAKKNGVKFEKVDPANKEFKKELNRGNKFEQPGQDGVDYQFTDDDIPMLVLLAEFPDTALGAPEDRVPASYLNDLVFGEQYNPYEIDRFKQYEEFEGIKAPTNRTMANLYKEASYGKVTLTTYDDLTDIGWITLPKEASYYLEQSDAFVHGNVNGDARIGELLIDLLQTADEKIDFSKYAVDGEVPNIFIVHEGTGAEFSTDPAQIWSHKWNVLSAAYWGKYYETGFPAADVDQDGNVTDEEIDQFMNDITPSLVYDGVVVNNYTVEPEIGGNVAGYDESTGSYSEEFVTGPYPAQPGVFAHEFGHALGLPDFYDTDYSSRGVGQFSLMAGGSWNRYPNAPEYSGNSPAHFDPFSKVFLGWVDPIEVTPEDGVQEITLKPINESPDVVKMAVPGSNGTEYFLIENVQQQGFNEGFNRMGEDASGLVIWHVDENVIKQADPANKPNNVENWKNKRFQQNQEEIIEGAAITHYGLSVLQADGKYDLEKDNNSGEADDFFKTGDKITPNSKNVHTGSYYFWKGFNSTPADSGIHVTDIVENEDGSITANFYYDN